MKTFKNLTEMTSIFQEEFNKLVLDLALLWVDETFVLLAVENKEAEDNRELVLSRLRGHSLFRPELKEFTDSELSIENSFQFWNELQTILNNFISFENGL